MAEENEANENMDETPTTDELDQLDAGEDEQQESEPEVQNLRKNLGNKVSTSPGSGLLKAAFIFVAGASLAGGILTAAPYMNTIRYGETEVSGTTYVCKVSRQHHLNLFFGFGGYGKLLRDTYTVREPAESEEVPWERLESQTLRFRYADEIGTDSPDIVVLTDNGADGTVDVVRSYTLTWDLSNGEDGPDWFSAPAVTREELSDETAALLDTILADYRERMDVETHCD